MAPDEDDALDWDLDERDRLLADGTLLAGEPDPDAVAVVVGADE